MSRRFVYFIQRGGDGPIKIGTTSNKLRSRLREVQIGSPDPLYLIGHIRGLEADVHIRFQRYRISGEWFEPHEDILNFVRLNRLPAPLNDEYIPMSIRNMEGPLRVAVERERQKASLLLGEEVTAGAVIRGILKRALLDKPRRLKKVP
jgi:hypothetical protein